MERDAGNFVGNKCTLSNTAVQREVKPVPGETRKSPDSALLPSATPALQRGRAL